jgi:thioredoxin-dependent peroxiredoxin
MAVQAAPGAKAPDFTVSRDGGSRIGLADYRGRKLVLYFYPKAETSGCTREAIDFSRLASQFAKARTAILGVSPDSVAALDRFKAKHDLTIALASDPDRKILSAYGAWGRKTMYGRSFMGVIRSTVLIDADGRLARRWDKVKVAGHAEEVLAAAQSL